MKKRYLIFIVILLSFITFAGNNTSFIPTPKNGAEAQPLNTIISWKFEKDNDFTYDIYFGTVPNPSLKNCGHTSKSYDPGTLSYNTTYYWKIVAKDGKGGVITGPVWSFTTKDEPTPPTEEMVLVEGGTFQMGDIWGDGAPNERPVHEVTFTYDYYIGEHEVTFEEYDKFCEETGKSKPDDEGWGRGQQPVINISWWDAVEYCNWFSEKQGLPKAYDEEGNLLDKHGNKTTDITKVQGYRLPTEAEWEYAARGGNKSNGYKYSGSNDPDEVAWYAANSGKERINIDDCYYNEGKWEKVGTGVSTYYIIYVYYDFFYVIKQNLCKTHRVKQKLPNELGIYDMSGNVWEFCHDLYDSTYYERSPDTNPYNHTTGSYRVGRGGSWGNLTNGVRVARRAFVNPDFRGNFHDVGFRVCRTAF